MLDCKPLSVILIAQVLHLSHHHQQLKSENQLKPNHPRTSPPTPPTQSPWCLVAQTSSLANSSPHLTHTQQPQATTIITPHPPLATDSELKEEQEPIAPFLTQVSTKLHRQKITMIA